MDARIVMGNVASAIPHHFKLRGAAGLDANASADRIPAALSLQSETDPVRMGIRPVFQKQWLATDWQHHEIDFSIVIEIASRSTAPGSEQLRAADAGELNKPTGAI